MAEVGIELSDLIVELRKELLEAQKKGEDSGLRFKVDAIDIEAKVAVFKAGKTSGGVKFWVYNTEVAGELGKETVQTIRIKLTPKGEDGGDLEVSDISARPND